LRTEAVPNEKNLIFSLEEPPILRLRDNPIKDRAGKNFSARSERLQAKERVNSSHAVWGEDDALRDHALQRGARSGKLKKLTMATRQWFDEGGGGGERYRSLLSSIFKSRK